VILAGLRKWCCIAQEIDRLSTWFASEGEMPLMLSIHGNNQIARFQKMFEHWFGFDHHWVRMERRMGPLRLLGSWYPQVSRLPIRPHVVLLQLGVIHSLEEWFPRSRRRLIRHEWGVKIKWFAAFQWKSIIMIAIAACMRLLFHIQICSSPLLRFVGHTTQLLAEASVARWLLLFWNTHLTFLLRQFIQAGVL